MPCGNCGNHLLATPPRVPPSCPDCQRLAQSLHSSDIEGTASRSGVHNAFPLCSDKPRVILGTPTRPDPQQGSRKGERSICVGRTSTEPSLHIAEKRKRGNDADDTVRRSLLVPYAKIGFFRTLREWLRGHDPLRNPARPLSRVPHQHRTRFNSETSTRTEHLCFVDRYRFIFKFSSHDRLKIYQVVGTSMGGDVSASEDDRLQHSAIIPRIVALRSGEAPQIQETTVSGWLLVWPNGCSNPQRQTSSHTSNTPEPHRPGPVPRLPTQVGVLDISYLLSTNRATLRTGRGTANPKSTTRETCRQIKLRTGDPARAQISLWRPSSPFTSLFSRL